MLTITPLGETPDRAIKRAFDFAPYLQRLSQRDVAWGWEAALAHVRRLPADADSETVMAELRRAKSAVHFSLAAHDLAGTMGVMEVTRALSEFAGASLDRALHTALAARGLDQRGIFLAALGKMGAFELNYSSDIDAAAFYDPNVFDGGERHPGEAAQRVIRDVVRLMEERTRDGYVFRTDLRLRPDPSSTPLAVSTEMASVYYESVGQNWERMVWIKGRPCAGDIESGDAFLEMLRPFVWRRHLDYWAIADIQAIKRMINRKSGGNGLDTPAPDVKLGPGGIREIEFFVQTQQLILGGRFPGLRQRGTLEGLAALVAHGVVDAEMAEILRSAYLALRNLEHRIQMQQDEQTHTVPAEEAARADVAALCGYDDLAAFDADLLATRRAVQDIYDSLFAQEDRAASDHGLGNLVFTGVDDDPGTLDTLSSLGFSNPSAAIETIRNWHRGRVPATRTERGREILTAMLPNMLEAMGHTGEPDEAFRWFSRFFEGLSSGVQTLSMLMAEPELLNDLVTTLALAPRLASILSRRPDLLEVLISGQAPDLPDLSACDSFDERLDAWRRYHREQSFLIGHRLLHGLIAAEAAARHWTALADQTIQEMATVALEEVEQRSGTVPGRWAVFAMGKLGGGELTAGSDLDIILIYDADPLDAQTVYTRFTQRLITALSAPTAEGALYEVDMRLRPSGRSGPVAVSLPAFETYQNGSAWTWEHMALTRLRHVAGDQGLGRVVLDIGRDAIIRRANENADAIRSDIRDMRLRLYREKPGAGLWDLKSAQGGLVDIEFILQQEMLLSGEVDHIQANIKTALDTVAMAPQDRTTLQEATAFYQSLQQVQRLALGTDPAADAIPEGLKNRFCRAVGAEDFEALERRLRAHKDAVHAVAVEKMHLSATDFDP